ncbi:MarR family winged helix-turn-helix transcriptional regulator [Erythrobacter rubeus]|uniref:MarR family transcriptional regulator n=1 Tax=Erythrobacter rubeus TaxID=2760803 RepID=A0ABR8KXM4_9SPHN|nr:MarR family transcriptional regulator [Erythrobacter rubeus]MBD2842966.1 MarR family transcriptional regulator [Erythrobacter rubeus]
MSTDDPLAYQVFNEIGIIDQLASHTFTQSLPRGMTIAQFGILNHFVRLGHDYRTPAQLASAFQVSRPTMTNTLARLERRGLVEIAPDPADGRAKRVSITASGVAMREECLTRLAGPLAEVNEQVPDDLLQQLLPLLADLRQILDRMRD